MTTNSPLLRAFLQGLLFGVIGAFLCHMNCVVDPRYKPLVDREAVFPVRGIAAADNSDAPKGN